MCYQAATGSGVKTLTSWLWVNKPSASILGSREKHVNLGDSVTISCELRDTVVAPQYVFWYHNNNMINFQPGVTVVTVVLGQDSDSLWVAPPNTTVARLTISQTKLEDAGNYTCAPENMVQDTVRLSISKGKHWAGNILQTLQARLASSTSGQRPKSIVVSEE